MDNFLKIKGFLYYQFLIIENYLYLWKNGTSKIDEGLYYNEYNDGYFKKRPFKGGVPQNANILKLKSIKCLKTKKYKRASLNKIYPKLNSIQGSFLLSNFLIVSTLAFQMDSTFCWILLSDGFYFQMDSIFR